MEPVCYRNSPNMSANAVSQGRPNNDAPSTYSTTGAFNGSGIALASQSFSSGGYGSIVMYFQHHTGQIRSAQLGSDGRWKGGDATEIVAVDAKNGTPIAAVAYARNNIAVVSLQKGLIGRSTRINDRAVAHILPKC